MHRFFVQLPSSRPSESNCQKVARLQSIIHALLEEMLVAGFHGVGTVRFSVQDGTIQGIEEVIERSHR